MNKRQKKKFLSSIGIAPRKRFYSPSGRHPVIVVKGNEISVRLMHNVLWTPQLKFKLQREMRKEWNAILSDNSLPEDLSKLDLDMSCMSEATL